MHISDYQESAQISIMLELPGKQKRDNLLYFETSLVQDGHHDRIPHFQKKGSYPIRTSKDKPYRLFMLSLGIFFKLNVHNYTKVNQIHIIQFQSTGKNISYLSWYPHKLQIKFFRQNIDHICSFRNRPV